MPGCAYCTRVAMNVDMTGVGVDLICVQRQVDMRDCASLILVLVGMRVHMPAAVKVAVEVNRVAVVVVTVSVGLV